MKHETSVHSKSKNYIALNLQKNRESTHDISKGPFPLATYIEVYMYLIQATCIRSMHAHVTSIKWV